MLPTGLHQIRTLVRYICTYVFGAIVGIATLVNATAQGAEQPEVTWAVTPLPPAMLERDDEIVGYGIDILDWFSDRLPDYHQTKEIIPLARLLKTLSGPGTFCAFGMNATPERQQFLHFTDVVQPHLPVSLILDASRSDQLKNYLNTDGDVDLEKLIIHSKLNGVLRSQRSYGPEIDAILRRHIENPRITHIGNDANFLQLIALGRMDWTLYLPAEAEYYRRTKVPEGAFSSWNIAGNDQLMPASIACSKTQTGKNIVDAINLLMQNHPEMPWTEFYSSSLSASDQIRYQKALEDYTNTRTPVAPN